MPTAQDAARTAEQNPVVRALARAGYAANGVVHALIGGIVLAIAAGGEGESDQSGAFKTIADAPAGFVALWALAVALAALGLWHAAAALRRGGGDRSAWGTRISEAGQALVFIALGVVAASVALGARPVADDSAEEASRGVLSIPGGPFVLGAVGVGIVVGGAAFVVMGVRRSYRTKMSIPAGPVGVATDVLGVFGFVAKGVSLLTVGVLLVIAAVTVDADQAGGLDGAIRSLLAMPAGPFIVSSVGVGFIAYGIFCGLRARFARF